MKYTSALVALTASFALGNSIIENKSKCPAFLKEVSGLTGSINNRKKRAVQGRKKVRGQQGPFIQTPEPGSGDEVTTAEVTTVAGSGEEVTIAVTEAATTEVVTTDAVTTKDPVTTGAEKTTTPALTTDGGTTQGATTEVVTSEAATTEVQVTSEPSPEDENLATIIILDETGSMQYLGGKSRQGRKIIIRKFNTFMNNLKEQVRSGEVADSSFTFVTFNRKARWVQFDSILEMPQLTPKHYNPGYGTNLYDTIGCVMAKFNEENDGASNVRLFVISDGAHKLGPKERRAKVGYEIEEIEHAITGLREQGWDFAIYGAVNENEKKRLKQQALNMGFRQSERKMFDFSKNSMGALLKSMLASMSTKTETEEKTDLPDCKVYRKCKKGKGGKMCRRGRKSLAERGECKFY